MNTQQRKNHFAKVVLNYLNSLGHNAKLLENKTNSSGHRDQVVIASDLGLVHVTATESSDPNASISTADYKTKSQTFLTDKMYVVFCWETKDKRALLMFVEPEKLKGFMSLTKSEIKELSNKDLSTVLKQS